LWVLGWAALTEVLKIFGWDVAMGLVMVEKRLKVAGLGGARVAPTGLR